MESVVQSLSYHPSLECLSSPLLDQDELIRSTFVDSVATLYYINECDDPLGNPLLRIVQEAFLVKIDKVD